MTNKLATPNLNPTEAVVRPLQVSRENVLHAILGSVDYEYAQKSGLIDMFYYDEKTGEDGLVHTLAGDFKPGTTIPQGFHHVPSAEAVWPTDTFIDDSGQTVTRSVTRVEPGSRTVYPAEPSFPFVTIGGLQKVIPQRKTGKDELEFVRSRNSMFPSEYDALAVMQAIRIARDTRDTSKDKIVEMKGSSRAIVKTEGTAPLIDGKSSMTIKFILDKDSGKVITAYPKIRDKPIMGLGSEEEMWALVNDQTDA